MHTVTLYHFIIVYNNRFIHVAGIMQAVTTEKIQRKENLNSAMKISRQKLPKYYAEVTLMTGRFPISAHILDHFAKFQLFRMWLKGLAINALDKKSYTTQYQ